MLAEKNFPRKISVWENGTFGIECANGVYKSTSAFGTVNAFSVTGANLIASTSNTSLVSLEKIDFTSLTKISAISNYGTNELDVTNISGEAYLAIYRYDNTFTVHVSSQQQYFETNSIARHSINGSGSLSISKIIIE